MQNSKNFGLSDSLIEAVKEALHPNQKKLDKNKNGKLDKDDFEKLRGEEAEHVDEAQTPQQKAAKAALATQRGEYDAGKKGGAINRMALMKKKDLQKIAKGKTKKEEVAEAAVTGNEAHGYHGNVQAKDDAERAKKYSAMHTKTKKLVGAAGHLRDAKHPNKMVKHFLDSPHGRHIAYDPSDKNITSRFGHFKKSYKPHMHEEVQVAEADEQDPVAKQIAAKKEQMKKQIQQKIAQKQMSVMQQKAQKKIQSIKASTHDDMENDMKKKGKDPVEVNPELREAEDLPKKVIKKGHEIAKSLIKHKADVKEPYAVGMATAKKSAGIKD